MAQRSRKRGRRKARHARPAAPRPAGPARPAEPPESDDRGSVGGWRVEPQMTRSQRRDAEVRAGLTPIKRGERPGAIVAATILSGLIGLSQLIAFFAGLKVQGKSPAAVGTILFCGLMIVCAIGMWRLWYGAVLGFMALLAIVATLFSLFLIEASNLLALVVVPVIVGSGYLFFKLVRVLSRIQMPRYPGR
ncbi:MAG: hypothetical protein ACRDNK_00100 [Solirubrobacteraceae bacterium]